MPPIPKVSGSVSKIAIKPKLKNWNFGPQDFQKHLTSGVLERQIVLFESIHKLDRTATDDEYILVMENWIPLLDNCVTSVIQSSIQSLINYRSLDELDKWWTKLTKYIQRIVFVIHSSSMKSFNDIEDLVKSMDRKKWLKTRQDSVREHHNRLYEKMKQNPTDANMIDYFLVVYGPVSGKKEYLDYASFCSLSQGLTTIVKSMDMVYKNFKIEN
jgi:hypothetical protein